MEIIRPYRNGILALVLFLFISTLFLTNPASIHAAKPLASSSTDSNQKLYNLHHGVIPSLLFSDNGAPFFNDLFSGKSGPFMSIVEEALGKTYAAGIQIVPAHYPDFDMVLMTFPAPAWEPLNYHAALIRINGVFRYVTLEKGNNIGSSDVKSFFCEWSADHKHMNYGPRNYDTLAAFRDELVTFLKK